MEQEVNYIEVSRESVEKGLRQMLKAERLAHWNAQKDAPKGLKSDPYHQLERDGKLNAEFFLSEAPKIMNKKSDLSADLRNYITSIMDAAMAKAVRWKQQKEAAEAAAAANVAAGNTDPADAAPAEQETEAPVDAAPAEQENAEKATKSNKKAEKSDEKPAKTNKKAEK